MPTTKVTIGLLAGALTTLVVWALSVFAPQVEVPAPVAAACTTIITFALAWLLQILELLVVLQIQGRGLGEAVGLAFAAGNGSSGAAGRERGGLYAADADPGVPIDDHGGRPDEADQYRVHVRRR